ncbi:hypothetical protein GCM10023224_15540 [Streptomonospora halophila]|uniref:3'-phosphoadenosine 5'-phosphosulfate sulfotransferase (PAPS reductase)/FAD synthetase n=1 Tax=Streptomonospora halophila TaxID=427369 RepID=A0ABP9GAM9_9ACTN
MAPRDPHRPAPALKLLSLGAGVQSSTLLLLAAHGAIPTFDHALFADTGWEPPAVYRHLERLEAVAADAGIPLLRVAAGNIRDDALSPEHRFASMPLFIKGPNGERRMGRRQCTSEYKVRPLKREARRLLGYPHPARVPTGVTAEQAIGISVDEVHRAKDADVGYLRNVFPLLDIGWTRRDCAAFLTLHDLGDTPKSACIGCPFRSNESWAEMRATDPASFEDAVTFDAAIRHGPPGATANGMPLQGTAYLHRDRIPLDQVDFGIDTGPEPDGCSPWSCRGDEAGSGPAGGGAA